MSSTETHTATLRFTRMSGAVPTVPRTSLRQGITALLRTHATPGGTFMAVAILYLLLGAVAFFVSRPTTLLYYTDYWEHRAIIAEIVRHGTHVLDPIYGEGASSRQFTPWSFAIAYLARFGRIDLDTAMACGAMLVSLLFVFGVHGFARTYFAHRWAPAVLLVTLTCGWGLPPLNWTGFYGLRSQLHGNYYPAALVLSLSFIAWTATLQLLKRPTFGLAQAALLWAVTACSVITHPLNAAFLVAGAGGFALLQPGIAATRRIAVLAVVSAGVGATIFWPYFNPLSLAGAGLARGQATFNNFDFFFSPIFVIATSWPAIFALLGLPGLLHDTNLRVPLLALAMTFVAYVVGGIADVSVSHRLLAYVILWLHVLLVKAALDTIDGQPPRMLDQLTARSWRGVYIVGAGLIFFQVALAALELIAPFDPSNYPKPLHHVEADTAKVVATLPATARILGWDSAALVMPSHGVLVAAFPRPMPLSPSDAVRQADYRRFFRRGTPTCERLAIARRWDATHVAFLTNELKWRVQRELRRFGPATSPAPRWRVIPVPPRDATIC